MSVSKEIIAWRIILEVLRQTGNYEMYDEEIGLVANEIRKVKEQDKEIERLNNIINKAIVYIENDIKVYYILDTRLNKVFDKTNKVKKDLLEILKGSDKE